MSHEANSVEAPISAATAPTLPVPTPEALQVQPASQPVVTPSLGPPVFPKSAIVGLGGEFANLHANSTMAPAAFLFVSYLGFFGAATGPHVSIQSLSIPTPPRLFMALVAESASDRKSTAMSFADHFFEPLVSSLLKVEYGFGSAEGIARTHAKHKLPILFFFDELKTFVDKTQQDGSIGLPMVNSLYEQTKYDNTTTEKPVSLRNCHLSILSACTVETFDRMWRPQYRDIGFINRLFLVTDRSAGYLACPLLPDPLKLKALQRKTEMRLKYYTQSQRQISFEPNAQTLWEQFSCDELSGRSAELKRLDSIGLRLMVLYAMTLDDPNRSYEPNTPSAGIDRITPEIVQIVIDLLRYEFSVRRLLNPMDVDTMVARLQESIRRQLTNAGVGVWVSKRHLNKAVNAHRYGTDFFENALRGMKESGEIDERVEGRSRKYALAPSEDE